MGFPSISTLVDLDVLDSAFHAIGSFRTYSNKTDASGNTTYTYVLGDSLANGSNYTGKLYAISKVQTNENPIMATNAMMKASIFRIPLFIKKSNKKVSKTVIITPFINEISKSKFSPIAIPKTSAKSQAAMAISAKKYNI